MDWPGGGDVWHHWLGRHTALHVHIVGLYFGSGRGSMGSSKDGGARDFATAPGYPPRLTIGTADFESNANTEKGNRPPELDRTDSLCR